jgi:CBS domain-containing protein
MKPTARDIMSTELLTVTPETTLEEVLKLIVSHKVTGVPVVDSDGKMVGVCSDYDVIRQFSRAKTGKNPGDRKKKLKAKGPKLFQRKIRYSKKVTAVTTDASIDDIVTRFVDLKFRRLPVIDQEGRLVGIITRRDMMRVFFYQAALGE